MPLLVVLAGLLELRAALAAFAHPVIFLFLGSFALAAALQQQGLDRALAVMMLPLALALLGGADARHPLGPREQAFVLLGVAYSASIGGIGTLVGSPPNAIAAAQAGIGFTQWLRFGVPLVRVLLPLMALLLYAMLRPRLAGRIEWEAGEPLVWNTPRRWALAIFLLTALLWMSGAPLARAWGIAGDVDGLVALAAIVALVGSGAIGWPQIERSVHWGVLLLFGGGLALSEAMAASGASRCLAGALVDAVQGAPGWLLLLGVVAPVVFLTELVSNTASAALLVPLFMGVAAAFGLPPVMLAAAIAVSASCAFMLPVATPPNAIVCATERVPQATMMRCGFVLNLVCIVVIAGLATLAFG